MRRNSGKTQEQDAAEGKINRRTVIKIENLEKYSTIVLPKSMRQYIHAFRDDIIEVSVQYAEKITKPVDHL